jgi:hypothetical protein
MTGRPNALLANAEGVSCCGRILAEMTSLQKVVIPLKKGIHAFLII